MGPVCCKPDRLKKQHLQGNAAGRSELSAAQGWKGFAWNRLLFLGSSVCFRGYFWCFLGSGSSIFYWENIFAEVLPVWALFSCFVGSAAQTYRCRLTAARLLRCWVCVELCSNTRSDLCRVREVTPRCVFDFSPRRCF